MAEATTKTNHSDAASVPESADTVQSASTVLLQPGQAASIPAVIAGAIVQIQAEVAPLNKNAENPHFKNSYVPLSEVMREALSLLSKYKLGITQWPVTRDEKNYLITIFMHETGAAIRREQELLLARRDSQGQGSSMTYARRYGIMAILGLVGDDDDDCNKAANRQTKPTPAQLSEIRQLCVDLKYPPDQIEARVQSLRTEDQAVVVIATLNKIMSEKASFIKDDAKAIPVFTGDATRRYPEVTTEDDKPVETKVDSLQRRLVQLNGSAEAKRKFIRETTGKPFVKNCDADQLKQLEDAIAAIEAGESTLPLETTPPEKAA